MTTELAKTNRLAKRGADAPDRIVPPTDPDERRKFWIERGNRILWGIEPTSKGDYLPPQRHLEWRCKDGHYFIAEIGR